LNEKFLAAKRSGIKEIIIPFKNKKDIPELPKELLEGLNIIPVKKADEVIKLAFNGNNAGSSRRSTKTKKKK